ncbi:hypothetical protein Hamer_G027989 [Homarus americanus]|uniref:Uncharacterized protein n=1 Tax=Homarus americanus TaxID=6706 RepID=A0A8J5MTU8_HOMAM|nr:hypothetical protein Hamer_G027989 [Homarus americanus]
MTRLFAVHVVVIHHHRGVTRRLRVVTASPVSRAPEVVSSRTRDDFLAINVLPVSPQLSLTDALSGAHSSAPPIRKTVPVFNPDMLRHLSILEKNQAIETWLDISGRGTRALYKGRERVTAALSLCRGAGSSLPTEEPFTRICHYDQFETTFPPKILDLLSDADARRHMLDNETPDVFPTLLRSVLNNANVAPQLLQEAYDAFLVPLYISGLPAWLAPRVDPSGTIKTCTAKAQIIWELERADYAFHSLPPPPPVPVTDIAQSRPYVTDRSTSL